MVQVTARYLGNKRVEVLHLSSGATITTSAPKDNNGDGLLFSPTDLMAAALGSCMLTVMGIVAERNNLSIEGAHCSVEKEMNQAPRRVGKLPVTIHLPGKLIPEERKKLELAALSCPVHHSLHEAIESPVQFIYDV